MKFKRIKSLLLILFLFTASVLFPQTIKLKIIETTDEHGAIFPFDFIKNKPANNSLAQISTMVNDLRKEHDENVILLSNGDILHGTPAVYYYNFEETGKKHLFARAMNYMKYDAGTVGNHDIETGHDVYDRFKTELDFPWLDANAVRTDNGEPYFPPYTVLERSGIKIAILGLITPGIPNWLPPKIWSGIVFEDMIATAENWVPKILKKEKPDVFVGLFHSGVDETYGGADAETPRNENAARLVAERVPGFDVVFVGHDHHGWNFTTKDPNGKDVLILGGRSYARDAAMAEIEMSFNGNSWDKSIDGKILAAKDFAPDEKFLSLFENDFESGKAYVNKKIGRFTNSISSKDALFGNSAFSDLIHKIQLEISGADVSLTAPLSMNAEISKGDIFVRDMFALYKYENLLYTMELTGVEIDGFLEYSYDLWFNQMKNGKDHLLKFVTDENGSPVKSERSGLPRLKNRYYNFDSAEGVDYIVDVSKPAGDRVEIISMQNGDKFDLNKKYRVAVNSYRGNGGGGHLTRGAGIPKDELEDRILNSTEKDLRFYMMKWIEKQGIVTPEATENWSIEPQSWYEAAKKMDYNLLFVK